MTAPRNYPSEYAGNRRRVLVADSVLRIWTEYRQVRASQAEAFGVLIGTSSTDKRTVWIDEVTIPMPGDRRSRHGFTLRDPGHQRAVDRAHKRSNGAAIYLGTWHTHPEMRPQPSGLDRADWRECLKRNRRRPLLFVIAGLEETRLFVPWGCFFRQLRCAGDGQ